MPERLVAVVRFSGLTSEKKLAARTAELSRWIAAQGLESRSAPRLARYDPPFTIPFLRRNEVQITVQKANPGSWGR